MVQVEKADMSKVGKDVRKVGVIFSHPTQDETKVLIKRIIENKLGRSFDIEYKQDPALVGGMVLELGTTIIDGSLVQSIKDASEKLKDELVWKNVL